ncbi:TerB family tellurite resistance protein [Emcibacteraceae bacterium]|uniref:tellurite resistance TerB family protein n=1 Tax=Pseudemcibacter sp. TaxID=2943293 RepID=UPI002308A314|nr:TerB family tellurite resistance protein [Emcibacteraceae bacterium]MDA9180336.1 TerB family tellurite resistance protein [Emcibacteraceae bacterium]MDA9769776.1 TerB family tellurite resistance protein [Emcibacteraceae bacterium]MDG1021833.1 TerB family tellurite resistance protein [Emcibacteraceae bacterium]MDG1726797.1 TerB family tellurite resistance protein [Emcibacteraceae bacterium]
MSIIKKIGNFFAAETTEQSKTQPIDAEKLAAAALMVEVAMQDGDYDQDERNVIEGILINKLKLSSEDALELLAIAEDKQSQSIQILSFTKEIKNHFDDQGRAHIMEMLWGVVFADGEEDAYESNLMRRIAGLLYISDKESGEIRKKVMQENNLL